MDYIRKTSAFFFSIIFLFSITSYSQPVKEIKLKPDSNRFEITRDNKIEDVLNINASISMLHVKNMSTKGGSFVNLESDGLVKIFGKGKPNLPVFSKLIEVPLDATVEDSIIGYDEEIIELKDYGIFDKIIPSQPSLSKSDDPENVPFYYDSLAYSKDQFIYTEATSFEDLGILRSVRLVRVEISPIQYNPVQNKLRILNNLKIEITFVDANHSKTNQLKSKYSSPLFNALFTRVVPNYEPIFWPEIKETITYIIISDTTFEATLQPFISWKETIGYNVIVAYTNEPAVGNTTTSIKNYLEDLYNNPPNGIQPPHFILFVGDVAQIPSFPGDEGNHKTDLYYCEYTGDALPEVFYGRFSANNVTQLQPQIDKTLEYERYSMPNPSYIHKAVLVAGADAGHATTYGNGQINYGTDNYFNFDNGITSQAYLQPEPAGDNYSEKIKTDINNGVGFANYTAHCSPNGWSNPVFSVSDIPSLTNSHKYGLWVGNCCKSNRFEESECFGEAALRAQNKGAVGYIGASNSTYWDEDFWWAVGFKTISANPSYDANKLGAYDRLFHTHGEPKSEWYSAQGQIIFGGNLAVLESTSSYKKYYWEIYHLMGDPSLNVLFVPGNFPPIENFPIISSLNPSEARVGQTLDVDIRGINFTENTIISFWMGATTPRHPIWRAPLPSHFEFTPALISVNSWRFAEIEAFSEGKKWKWRDLGHIIVNITIDSSATADGHYWLQSDSLQPWPPPPGITPQPGPMTQPMPREYYVNNVIEVFVKAGGTDVASFKITR